MQQDTTDELIEIIKKYHNTNPKRDKWLGFLNDLKSKENLEYSPPPGESHDK